MNLHPSVSCSRALVLLVAASACASPRPAPAQQHGIRVVSVLATADLHGHVEHLPLFAGYVANVRQARAADGEVLLLDSGDLFQGTLVSNLVEGAPVVTVYNKLGYAAAAVGNHEFDFGPVGPAATPTSPADDPRGALKARMAQSAFPFLSANLVQSDEAPPPWPNFARSVMVTRAGIRIGVIGASTPSTARTTLAANFVGLKVLPTVPAVEQESRKLRAAGAQVVLLVMHEGGGCTRFDAPDDLSSCKEHEDGFEVAQALAPGTVDAIIAGHTHQAVAHRVHGIPMVQAYANGRAFGRLDLRYDLDANRLTDIRIFPPRDICRAAPPAPCEAASYEDRPVEPDAAIAAMLAPDEANARVQMQRPLGVTLTAPLRRAYAEESPLGNLVADLMRQGQPGADVAITNGGGLRADLPQGPLTYGALYEALPFENRMATLTLTGSQLRKVLVGNLQAHGGIVSTSGIRATAACVNGALDVRLARADGRPIADDETLVLATTDFLATGGDGLFSSLGPHTLHDTIMRDVVAARLTAAGGTLSPSDKALFDATAPRLGFPGPRPVHCP